MPTLFYLFALIAIHRAHSFLTKSNRMIHAHSMSSATNSRRSVRTLKMIEESGRNLKFSVEGGYLSYDLFYASGATQPQIVYLPGLIREKNEAKSINLQALCKKNDMTFLSADYFGVGKSSGSFADGSISRWTTDAIELITAVLNKSGGKKVILVGHGLGTWISFLIALKNPHLVSGIVGMSADPDFTEELLWKTLSDEVKEKIMNDGVYEITWGNNQYPITRNLIEDGRKNLLLAGPPGAVAGLQTIRLSMQNYHVSYLNIQQAPST